MVKMSGVRLLSLLMLVRAMLLLVHPCWLWLILVLVGEDVLLLLLLRGQHRVSCRQCEELLSRWVYLLQVAVSWHEYRSSGVEIVIVMAEWIVTVSWRVTADDYGGIEYYRIARWSVACDSKRLLLGARTHYCFAVTAVHGFHRTENQGFSEDSCHVIVIVTAR
jgi:hypothetical protein